MCALGNFDEEASAQTEVSHESWRGSILCLCMYRSFSNFLSAEVSRLQSIQKGESFSRKCIISVVPVQQHMPPFGRRLNS